MLNRLLTARSNLTFYSTRFITYIVHIEPMDAVLLVLSPTL